MYSVSIRNSENVAVPRISPPTFAPATVFVRRIPKRISGSACRRSHQPNAASSATEAADRAPDAERDVALTALGERRREDRQRRRRDHRRAEPLERARRDQRRLRPGQARQQRGEREQDDAGEEEPPPTK